MGKSAVCSGDTGNVVSLDGRVLGACLACGRPICFADDFIRLGGAPVHLSCALVAAREMGRGTGVPPAQIGPLPPA